MREWCKPNRDRTEITRKKWRFTVHTASKRIPFKIEYYLASLIDSDRDQREKNQRPKLSL